MTRRMVESLLSASRADREDIGNYSVPLARLVLRRPELAAPLRPDGKFHRKILDFVLADPGMTPGLRSKLGENSQIAAYLL